MDKEPSLDGTYRANGVLMRMQPYGCWSDKPRARVVDGPVTHGRYQQYLSPMNAYLLGHNPQWEHVMSRQCRYDRKSQDERCAGCRVEYDQEYVDGLEK